ncbi:MAG: isoprenoid biosynthesis glyoxalase ElbB [Candidatus Eisenbacteria bacterium]|nr:isoprenoid biosynthesis glyoxalase ElbB [Candidatus Eisenbacteria bacterium]
MGTTKVGVILSGCGVKDGSEIHEAVFTLLEIARNGAEAVCMAPDTTSAVVDHLKGEATGEKRNALIEAARIARGRIRDLRQVRAADLDAIIVPGGLGAASVLCDFAAKGRDCAAHPEVERILLEMHGAGKPIGAICIAPALLASIFGRKGAPIQITIGSDAGTAAKLESMGVRHANRGVREICVDSANKIVTTPAYMLAETIDQTADGIALLVKEVVRLAP